MRLLGLATAPRGAAAFGLVALLAYGAHFLIVRSGAACPMRPPSTEALERQRQDALPALRGVAVSPSKDAFGFELGVTTRSSFLATSAARGDQCEDELDGALIRCEGSRGELVARFDPRGTLVGADHVRYVAAADDACTVFAELAAVRADRFGAPSRSWGSTSPSYLSEPLRQVGVAYRFVDVAVDLSVTHLGAGRIAIREQVRSIPRGLSPAMPAMPAMPATPASPASGG